MAISFPSDFIASHAANTTVTKTYASAVAAGDLLCAYVVAYYPADTSITVSDSVNGAWTQAGTITDPAGYRLIGFYKENSASGTPVVTLTGNTGNRKTLAISRVSGLTGGGTFDQWKANQGASTTPTTGASATLANADSAVVAGLEGGTSPTATDAGWTIDLIADLWGRERFVRKITTATTAVTAGWTSPNQNYAAAMMVFTHASGASCTTAVNATTANAVGSIASKSTSKTAVNATTANAVGTILSSSGVTNAITTPPLKNNTGTLLTGETGITVNIYHVTTGALVVQKTGQTSHGTTGVVTVTDALITPATQYRVVVILSNGDAGLDKITAT